MGFDSVRSSLAMIATSLVSISSKEIGPFLKDNPLFSWHPRLFWVNQTNPVDCVIKAWPFSIYCMQWLQYKGVTLTACLSS